MTTASYLIAHSWYTGLSVTCDTVTRSEKLAGGRYTKCNSPHINNQCDDHDD